MDLFAASGVNLGDGGKGGRMGRAAVTRTLHVPLLKHKVVAAAMKAFTFDIPSQGIEAAAKYARTINNPKFAKLVETKARPIFIEEILQKFLGYRKFDEEGLHTLTHEEHAGTGSVDVALGSFGSLDGKDQVVAPFELKGPTTKDLDAIIPGRGNLRKFLGDNVAIESVIDFSDRQIFEGVTTYPAILTLRKGKAEEGGSLSFLKIDEIPEDLGATFTASATAMPRARLGAGSWQFEDDRLARLRDKIVKGRKTLGEVYGAPLFGIKTGLNDAFIVDQSTHDRLLKEDKKSTKILKPFLRGENVKRWRVEFEGLFLINTPKGKVDINDYPAVRTWLLSFKKGLEARATEQQWFELQQAQLAYQPAFTAPKIVYQDITATNPFSLDKQGYLVANTCYVIPTGDVALLAYLNSKLAWFFFSSVTNIARGGYLRLRTEFVQQTPLPEMSKAARSQMARLAQVCTESADRRFSIQLKVRHRILDLTPSDRKKLSRKLEEWWTLDFGQFRDEIKRAFRTEIPLKERAEWESYLAKHAAEVRKLDAEIENAEREIDAIVYRVFELTADEIKLLEDSIAGQY